MLEETKKANLIAIGKILRTQGNKGELRVLPLTDFPERFQIGQQVFLELDTCLRKHKINSVRYLKRWVVLGFEEIEDMSAAERYRHALIKVDSKDVFKLPEGHYYVFQLVDLPVYTNQGEYLGNIKDVLATGGNDVYHVIHPETKKEVLLPAIKDCIQAIDLEQKVVKVKLLPGLLD